MIRSILAMNTVALATLLCAVQSVDAAERAHPLPPQAALATFRLEPGLRIELVAAEPLVVDPVAFAFDEDRRLYVVEARGYPDPIEGKPAYEGRVARLEDTNGDGRYDRRTEFATDLGFPNGILPWRGGVFVTCAPDILYLKDTTGDGIADERRVVLTGFDATKTSQLRVSHPTLGPDGKIYVTSGLTGGKVTSPEHRGRAAVTFKPADGRFDPETYLYETTGGRGQFGLSFDAFGRRFISWNRAPVLQVVLEPWHLERNPHLAFPDTVQEVSKVEAEAKVYPLSRSNISADFKPAKMSAPHTGTFTSACGVLIFDGTGLSAAHSGNVFICEPAQNLVQRQVFRPQGVSFRSAPPHKGTEFLASTDVWFRPVFLANGPDGALYIADMHRREIDHPRYFPEEARGSLDFESGKGTGRIYRVVREGGPTVKDAATGHALADLCRELESTESWWRERAQRLLVERADPAAVPLLEKCVSDATLAESRVRALWTLRGLGRLSKSTTAAALRDGDARVREQALTLAGEFLGKDPKFVAPIVAMANDPDPRVRFVAALVLGSSADERALQALAAIAVRDGEDRWARAAVLTGMGSRMAAFLEAINQAGDVNPQARAAVMEDLGRIFGAGAPQEECRRFLAQMVAGVGGVAWRLSAVLGLAEGLQGRSGPKGRSAAGALAALMAEETQPSDANALNRFFQRAAEIAADDGTPLRQRMTAVALLAHTQFDRSASVLAALLDARHSPELQLQAVRALDRLGDPRGGELLIQSQNWSRATPQIREAVISTLVSKPKMIEVLFEAIQRGVIKPPEITPTRRTQLLKHADPAIRQGAEKIFGQLESGDRMQVYQAYRGILTQSADAARGAEAFTRTCSACHTYNGVGGKVGPDLSGVRNQPADALLLHILVPNYEVAPGYQSLSVTTQDGRTISGWLTAETENSLTLRTAFGTEETVLRNGVGSLTASGVSLMPDGLEQTMTKDELANLIAYLKGGAASAR